MLQIWGSRVKFKVTVGYFIREKALRVCYHDILFALDIALFCCILVVESSHLVYEIPIVSLSH